MLAATLRHPRNEIGQFEEAPGRKADNENGPIQIVHTARRGDMEIPAGPAPGAAPGEDSPQHDDVAGNEVLKNAEGQEAARAG